MNILVLTPGVPYPPTYGGSVRIYNMIRQMSLRHAVHLLTYRGPGAGDMKGLEPYTKTISAVPRIDADKRWRQFQSLFFSRSFQWHRNDSRAMQEAIDRVVREQKIDLILVEFSQMAGFVFPPGIPVVLDEHNVEFDLLNRMAAREVNRLRRTFNRVEATKFQREELAACRAAVLTLVTSTRDEELLQQHAPGLRTVVISNGVDCDYFMRPPGPRHPDTAVFVGATHYFPNKDGVLFFLQEIAALIRQARPQFRFQVVGGRPPPAILEYRSASVEVTGFVDDVRPYMWDASIFVVPLRMGGGTRFKIFEAMAAGVPVVSTRLGAEGIPAADGKDLLLADEPDAFARAVVRVLTDPALSAKLVENGLEFVRRHFDWSVIGKKLNESLESAVQR